MGKSHLSFRGAALVVVAAVLGCSLYANLALLVKSHASFGFFPPFESGKNVHKVDHLGGEYYSIAGALVSGRGFADPFQEQTGPTAWMPPVFCWVMAAFPLGHGQRPGVGHCVNRLAAGSDANWDRLAGNRARAANDRPSRTGHRDFRGSAAWQFPALLSVHA